MGSNTVYMDSTEYSAAVAENVKTAIAHAGRSVLSISTATGIPKSTLDRRLRSKGYSPFTVAEVKAIANEIGTTASDLQSVYLEKVLA